MKDSPLPRQGKRSQRRSDEGHMQPDAWAPREFRFPDHVARQLELRVRDLQKADAVGGPPPLLLSIAAPDLRSLEGQVVSRSVEVLDVANVDGLVGNDSKATERLQRAIAAYVERAATTPIVLAVTNTGASGVRNLYVEMDITASTEIAVTEDRKSTRLN